MSSKTMSADKKAQAVGMITEKSGNNMVSNIGGGAASGFMLGGAPGAAIGAGIGLAGGLLSAAAQKRKAKREKNILLGNIEAARLQAQSDAETHRVNQINKARLAMSQGVSRSLSGASKRSIF